LPSRKPCSKRASLLVASTALLPLLVTACTSTGGVTTLMAEQVENKQIATDFSVPQDGVPLAAETDGDLPAELAYIPAPRPGTAGTAIAALEPVAAPAETAPSAAPAEQAAASTFPAVPPAPSAEPPAPQVAAAAPEQPQVPAAPPAAPQTETVAAAQPADAPQETQQKRTSFLSAFFGSAKPRAEAPAEKRPPLILASYSGGTPSAGDAVALSDDADEEAAEAARARPIVPLSPARQAAAMDSLPGVRTTALFEIRRGGSGPNDDSDVDLHEEDEAPVRVASAAGMARLAPNGLLKQTDNVDVSCIKPALLRVLGQIESHYGQRAIVTSGYRDPFRNRRARGARNSLHMFCAAADIQIPGVSKWELAQYARSMPGRGGVGTYCHTESVHIDVGPERDWNWRCRRRK
jgi:uncharacterized protein YcbK (DUF882 family)